jgi:UDP-N-acetyl-D-mannosaminuronic acid transferase (WecB/TagA/CpsF family)
MLLEPRRLGKRYLIENTPFFLHLARYWAARRLRPGGRDG